MMSTLKIKEEKDLGSSSKFEMRAPPRRRAKGEDVEEQPVFLRKAFAMISSCPSDIGGWSQKGDTVIIKDAKQFAEKIIPTSYKHNNFSSFVRQLNFYGFRKVKSESLDNPSWWEFRHPQFLRDQPQLISEIKRSVHFVPESATSKEVTDLKSQVSTLTERLEELNHQVEYLSNAVRKLQLISPNDKDETVDVGKKRKIQVQLPRNIEAPPFQRMASSDSAYMMDQYKMEHDEVPLVNDFKDFTWFQNDPLMESDGGNMLDGDFEEGLLLLTATPRTPGGNHNVPSSSSVAASATPASPSVDGTLPVASIAATVVPPSIGDLTNIIESLSPELKMRFLDKVAESMGAHLALNGNFGQRDFSDHSKFQHPPTYNSTPSFLLPSGTAAPEIALPLASAALGAFMQHSFHNLKHGGSVAVQDQVVQV